MMKHLLIILIAGFFSLGIGAMHPGRGPAVLLPMAPEVKVSFFNKALMDSKKDSPFGFKDANMLRIALLSWYDDYARVMNELGAYWMEPSAIWAFRWNLIQKRNEDGSYGEFDWERYDRLIKHAQAHNIHISAKIHADQPRRSPTHGPRHRQVIPSLPDDMKAYRTFVKAVIERYDGDGRNDMPGLLYPIKRWKVEDEAIYPMFFAGTGSDYATLLTSAYEAIKSADAEAKVICAMIYATYGPLGSRNPRSFISDFFKKLAELNKRKPYDIIDYHWIMMDAKMSPKKQYLLLKEELSYIDRTARIHGFQSAPFESLETGARSPDEKTQANNLLTHYVYALSCGVKKIFWSGLKAKPDNWEGQRGKQREDPFRRNTLIFGNDTRKLAYYTYRKMVDILDGSDWERIETISAKDDLYIFKFYKTNKPIWVLWNNAENKKKVSIKIPGGISQIKITEAIPKFKAGKTVHDYNQAFNETIKKVSNNKVEITVGDVPLFVEVE